MADWSRIEVEAVVADYLDMLAAEVKGEPFSKTAHRNALAPLLDQRSDGSIERKHQNISAVLIELGYPYVNGYKPLGNYQGLLSDVTSERLAGDIGLAYLLANEVVEPATVPSVRDILARLEQAPEPAKKSYDHVSDYRAPKVLAGVNYLRREAENASLGRAGEEFIVNFERARLIHAGKARLADKVEHASIAVGDGLGYDVRSFEVSGKDRLIEVKTTGYGKATPFFVSRNEVAASRHFEPDYHLCRLFRFRKDPRLFILPGALDKSCVLDPVQFSARVA